MVLGTFSPRALAGKACIVTGAASGMGRVVAERFAEAGAHVVMADINRGPLEAGAAAIRDAGVEIAPVPVPSSWMAGRRSAADHESGL